MSGLRNAQNMTDVQTIGPWTFTYCPLVGEISLPSIKKIDAYVFSPNTTSPYNKVERYVFGGNLSSANVNYCYSSYDGMELIFEKSPDLVPLGLSRASVHNRKAKVQLREGITAIGAEALISCDCPVVVPSTCTSIGASGITKYTNSTKYALYIKATTPPTLASPQPATAYALIHIPIGTLAAYQSATNWATYSANFVEYDFDADPDNINQYCV